MKTIEELRKLMKDKRYSGSIQDRNAEFIREVENGFKALFPLRECHAEKIPEEIRSEYEDRTAQLDTSKRSIEEAKAQLVLLKSQTDRIETAGNLKKLREHLLLLEQTKLYLEEILPGRAVVIAKLSAEANQRYREAFDQTHDCYGCKWIFQQQQVTLCAYGCDTGKRAIPTAEITQCPDPSGQMLDRDRPIIRRGKQELTPYGVG